MIYRFGHFEIDDSARELRAGGRRVETEPKAFDLLVYLAANRDRAVSKDELLNAVWPRQIVTETALTRAIMKARRAVGDDSGSQSVIRTVHGHGYRFVAELVPDPDGPEAEAGLAPVAGAGEAAVPGLPSAVERPRGRRGVVIAIAAAAAILAASVLWTLFEEAPRADPGVVAVLPVDNRIADPELDWVRLGLMSLLDRMLNQAGIDTVPDRQVLAAVGDEPTGRAPGPETFGAIRRQTGASSVLYARLEREGGLNRLTVTLFAPDGRKTRRIIVGESPAALAADMAQVLSRVLTGTDFRTGGRFARYSTDPFVNEMYARALDLELQGRLEEARRLFRNAAELEPELFWLRYEIALCTRDLREWEAAERMFEALSEEARDSGEVRALVVTLNSHGIMHFNRNEIEEAGELFSAAWAAAEPGDLHSDRASVLVNLALVASRQGELERAASLYAEALAAFEAAGEKPSPAFLNNYAGLLLRLGQLGRARDYSERAVEGFRVMGNRRFEAPALNRLARILRRQGNLEAALQRHEEALAIYRDLDDEIGELTVMGALTSLYRIRGDLSRAEANAREVSERARNVDDEIVLGDAAMQMAQVDLEFSRVEEARAGFEKARLIFARVGDDQGLRAADTGLAVAALRSGDTPLAARIAQNLLETAETSGNEASKARAQLLNGRVAEAEGALDIAAAHYRAALSYARASRDVVLLPDVAVAFAGLELGRGNTTEAAELADEVRELAAASHDFRRLEARLALARGEPGEARQILEDLRRAAGEAWRAEDEALLEAARERA